MTQVTRFWPLLTGMHRYEKTLSTRDRGQGVLIDAPILAYLIETRNGRILYDVGCDYRKLADRTLRAQYYENEAFPFGPPVMAEHQRIPHYLQRLGLSPLDIDAVFIGHLHFDHCGGLYEMEHAEVHVHARELQAAQAQADEAYFQSDFSGDYRWKLADGEYDLAPGVRAIETPGHTAGHMSMLIELPRGAPILLAGDAADLEENIDDEVAPGLCWCDRDDLAVASIQKLKTIASDHNAEIWPNHDLCFFRTRDRFPDYFE